MNSTFCKLLLLIFLTLAGCKKDSPGKPSLYKAGIIQDAHGRQLILRGLNTSGEAKSNPDRLPYITEADVDREIDWGFNVVRYMVFWDAFEPEMGQFNENYLEETAMRIKWYTDRGIYVIIDMHQDNYSAYFQQFRDRPFGNCCIGAPDWAVITNGQPHIDFNTEITDIFDRLLSPDFATAWANFWKYNTYPHLQDHYVDVWKRIALRFKDNPYVIGYEFINEPGTGNVVDYFNGIFERYQLYNFYKRLISAVREIDMDTYLFINPSAFPSNQGGVSVLPVLDDPSPGGRKLVFATHCYTLEELGGVGGWIDEVQLQEQKRNSPVLIGEFACGRDMFPDEPDRASWSDWIFGLLDSFQYHWTYWSNTIETERLIFMTPSNNALNPDGSEKPFFKYMVRAYPRATAGAIEHFDFDQFSGRLNLSYIPDHRISAPTEIFLPEWHYPNGYELEIEGSSDYHQEFDETRHLLYIWINKSDGPIHVTIVPAV